MTAKTTFDNFLGSLLAEAKEYDMEVPEADVVTLDQRVDLYLRAMHAGEPQREFTPEERTEARAKIIGYMAEDLARQIEARKRKHQQGS